MNKELQEKIKHLVISYTPLNPYCHHCDRELDNLELFDTRPAAGTGWEALAKSLVEAVSCALVEELQK